MFSSAMNRSLAAILKFTRTHGSAVEAVFVGKTVTFLRENEAFC